MAKATSAEAAVDAGWQRVREDGRVRTELLEAAFADPRLRQLFPWTGMGELHFSRCTEQPWTWDIPFVAPAAGGTYRVCGPLRDETVGPAATAQEAVAMVVGRLPPGCGPAFLGTPEELAAFEARQDIPLRLDRATAEDLYVMLYEVGEHIAAGAPITVPSAGESERLGRLLRDLAHTLGRHCSPFCDHVEVSGRNPPGHRDPGTC